MKRSKLKHLKFLIKSGGRCDSTSFEQCEDCSILNDITKCTHKIAFEKATEQYELYSKFKLIL